MTVTCFSQWASAALVEVITVSFNLHIIAVKRVKFTVSAGVPNDIIRLAAVCLLLCPHVSKSTFRLFFLQTFHSCVIRDFDLLELPVSVV